MTKRTRLSLTAAILMALPVAFGPAQAAGQSEEPLDRMAANHWAGTWTYIEDSSTSGRVTTGPIYTEGRDSTSRGEVTADDPRIAGTMTEAWNTRSMASGESAEGDVNITQGRARIDNAEGAWVGTTISYGGQPGQELWYVLAGEGAYVGLTAVFRWHGQDSSLQGVILPAELPALPDPLAAPAE